MGAPTSLRHGVQESHFDGEMCALLGNGTLSTYAPTLTAHGYDCVLDLLRFTAAEVQSMYDVADMKKGHQ